MADTITIPGMGPVKKNTALIFGVLAVGVIAVAVYRRNKASTAQQVQPADVPINPTTGYPYGSPQDLAAATYPSGVVGSGGGSGSLDTQTAGSGGLPVFPTNAAWTQYAQQYLVNNQNADPMTVGLILGKYVTGQGITRPQADIVNNAIGIAGMPPVSGVGGFPPSMHILPDAPTPRTTYTYKKGLHITSKPESGLELVKRFSVAGAPEANYRQALTMTVNDPANKQFRPYFNGRGSFPAGGITVTTVARG